MPSFLQILSSAERGPIADEAAETPGSAKVAFGIAVVVFNVLGSSRVWMKSLHHHSFNNN
jgi:hypothetical protein